MWVDKYMPRSFLELLGDEEINREVVKWLKCWDRCVFGDRTGEAPGRAAKGRPAQGSRPEEKILLICGAPGDQLSQPRRMRNICLTWKPPSNHCLRSQYGRKSCLT